jgi:hypothetical protein
MIPKTSKQKEELLSKIREMREAAVMGNSDLFDRMEESKRFTYRDQWDPAVKAWNKKKGKFTLQVPLIKPIIKHVVGMQLQNPKELKVDANRGGSETGARILTKLGKHAADTCNLLFQKTQWFEAGLSSGAGFIGVFIDRNEDPKNGNLKIIKLDEDNCAIDPDCTCYDPNDFSNGAKYIIWEPWEDKELIEKQYPSKVKELSEAGYEPVLNDTTGFWSRLWGGFRNAISTLAGDRVLHTEKLYEHKYHLTHCFWRNPKRCFMFYREDQNEMDAILVRKERDIAKIFKELYTKGYTKGPESTKDEIYLMPPEGSRLPEITAYRVVQQVICHTITCGDLLLDHIEDEFNGVNIFPIVPFSPYFDCGWRGGMAEDLKGTQEEINFSHSQKLNILKKLPNSGWYIKQDPLGTFAEWLEEHGAEDNIVIDLQKAGGDVRKIEETKYPSGWERNEELSIRNLHLISGVRSEDASYDESNLSGKAILAKQQASMTGNSPILQNFDYSQTILNKLIVEILRANKVYSMDEILEIVDSDEMIEGTLMEQATQQVVSALEQRGIKLPEHPGELSPEAAAIDKSYAQNYLADLEMMKQMNVMIAKIAKPVAMDMLYEEIHNLKKGKYNCTVTMSPYSPTMRMASMAERLEINEVLIKSGLPPLPARRLLEASSIEDKDEIIREMEEGQQAMQQAKAMAG